MERLADRYLVEWPGPWWWVGAFAFAALLATMVFFERQPWTRRFRYYLAASRAALAILLTIFVANPLLRVVRNRTVPPTLTLAVDDSRSVATFLGGEVATYKKTLTNLASQAEKAGYTVRTVSFDGEAKADSLRFAQGASNLDALRAKATATPDEGRLGPVVFCTDGLDTYGGSLAEHGYGTPVFALTVGKADKRPDSKIVNVASRRTVQAGADYPLTIYLAAEALPPARQNVYISVDGQPTAQYEVGLGGAARTAKLDVLMQAGKPGLHTVKILLKPIASEQNTGNNEVTLYIEAAALRKRVLVAAAAPHPDVKAILLALANRDMLAVEAWYPSLGPPPAYKPDVLVLHGLPAARTGMPAYLQNLVGKTPTWYILTPQSDLAAFNKANGLVTITAEQGRTDEVTGALAEGFASFSTQGISQQTLNKLPPLDAPYGSYKPQGPWQIMLNQQIGASLTGKPLWFFGGAGKGGAVLAGAGIWQWRLQESAAGGSAPTTDALIAGTIQLLLAQTNDRRFVFEPENTSVNLGDPAVFQTSLQDASGEPVYGNTVKLTYAGPKKGAATYVNASAALHMEVAGLPAGAYTYQASTNLSAERFAASGRFVVQAHDLESVETGANLPMLQALANRNKGIAADWHKADTLLKALIAAKPPGTIVSDEEREELRRQWWYILLMCVIFGAEWLSRRLKGGI